MRSRKTGTRTKVHKFHCELYHEYFYLMVGCSPEPFKDMVAKELDRPYTVDLQDSDGCTEDGDGGNKTFIWVRHEGIEGLPDLVHECVHAANMLFLKREITLDVRNDEIQTYLVQWIFNKCLKAMVVK